MAFHWVIPTDMWKFQQQYSQWQLLLSSQNPELDKLDRAANTLKSTLLQLNANVEKTVDIHEWLSVLGES